MLDRHGRLAPVHFDLMAAWIKDALSTDAEDDTEDDADDNTDDIGNAVGGEAESEP
jgi:hypothetical protein